MSSIERAMERARLRAAPERARAGADPADQLAPVAPTDPVAPAPVPGEVKQPPFDVEFDLARVRSQGMLTPDADQRELQEQYRPVKRQLIRKAFGEHAEKGNPANLIQITSSVADEGKTFTAFNLAMSIAMELDYTVLVVDADLTRRSLTELLGLDGYTGLSEVLSGSVKDVGQAVCRTNVPRLTAIGAGRTHPRSTELIASEAMRRLTVELASRYPDRLVIFDSTPLLLDSQAATLATHMGQILLVVEAGRTQEQVVREAAGMVGGTAAHCSLLLNKSTGRSGYGYSGAY